MDTGPGRPSSPGDAWHTPEDDDGLARATSDELMLALQRLTAIEVRKRTVAPESHTFVRLAEDAEREAQVIERWTRLQLAIAHRTAEHVGAGRMSGRPIEDIPPRPLARILAEWREAQFRSDAAVPASPEAVRAAEDIRRLREEYQASYLSRAYGPASSR